MCITDNYIEKRSNNYKTIIIHVAFIVNNNLANAVTRKKNFSWNLIISYRNFNISESFRLFL